MILYFFIYSLFLILLFNKKFIKRRNAFLLIWVFIFLISALRFDVGYDYTMYFKLLGGKIKFIDDQLDRLEFFSRQLVDISSYLKFRQLFFIVSSFLICYGFYKTIKENSLDIVISTLIFISFPIFYFTSFSIVRQYIAVSIVFYGFKYIKERRLYPFVTIIILAILFHKSAIIALPIYFMYNKFFNKNFILFIYVFGFFSSDFLAYLIVSFSGFYGNYIRGMIGEGGNLILLFFQLLGLILLPFVFIVKKSEKELVFYLLSFYCGLFIWSSLSKFGHAGIRGSLYYMSYFILLIPQLKSKIKQYSFVKFIMIILCFSFYFINLYIGSMHKIKDANIPYQMFFYKEEKDLKPNQ